MKFHQNLLWNGHFSLRKSSNAINKYNNLSAPRPDHVSQKHLKVVIEDNRCLLNIINIANACINTGHWPSHFKMSFSIIILKPIKMALIHLIHLGWVKSLQKSILAFDIAQFFRSLNHQLLLLILDKAGFDSRISFFFSNYLIHRKTQYLQNNYISPLFSIDISIGQSSTLSSCYDL